MAALRESTLPNLVHRGKVRDTHNLGGGLLLMVATDRISAFDVVLPTAIPEKGAVLCQMSAFWFEQTKDIIANHFVALASDWTPPPDSPLASGGLPREVARRAMVVRKAERVDIECVARGYITGSAWAEYRKSGTVCGQKLPSGLVEGDRFPETLFTPATKAETGHDENISVEKMADLVGKELTEQLRDITIKVYDYARDYALTKGIIIADTKMEFGFIDGSVRLIDELLTPDSSRFWDASGYAPGKSQPNFDKQYVRDWLNAQGWNHEPPAPELPTDVVEKTRNRYVEAFETLTGRSLA